MLHIGILLNEGYRPDEGGGYSYYDKLLGAIDEFTFDNGLEISFITTRMSASFRKPQILIESLPSYSKMMHKVVKNISASKPRSKLSDRIFNKQISVLKNAGVDLLYYPIQAQKTIPGYPFIATNWDIGHLSTYPFPEFSADGEYDEREKLYKLKLPQALIIFAESESGKKELVRFLNISETRIKTVPLFPGNASRVGENLQQNICSKFGLTKNYYFFYPAQFWAHKNHYGLVHAFHSLNLPSEWKLVLTGSDKGNQNYIRRIVNALHLDERVLFLGFVTAEELSTLYLNATALIMPTYLGPTNMPLLEANELGCPVACSNFEGHVEMLQDAALYFKPSDTDEIARSMKQIMDPAVRSGLLERGICVKAKSIFTVTEAVKRINQYFMELISVRKTWQ